MGEQEVTSDKRTRGARHAVTGVSIMLVFMLLFGIVIMLLWNWLMPEIFGLGNITYVQAVGLLLFSRVLFGRVGQSRDHSGYLTGRYGFKNIIGRAQQET